jgi:hypothetical protein
VLPELVVKALDVDETVFLELVASRVLAHNDGDGQIAKRRGAKPDTDLVKACGNRPQLRGLIVEALCHLTGRPHGYRDNYGEDFEAACRALRVDLGARAAKVAAELKAKKAAKPRAAKAATKAG